MARKTHLTLTDAQHAFLLDESIRTGTPMAELVRQAIDSHWRPHARSPIRGYDVRLSLSKRPSATLVRKWPRLP